MGPCKPLLDTQIRMLVGKRPALGTALKDDAPLMDSPSPRANVVHDIAPLIVHHVCQEASRAVSWCWIVFHNRFDLLLVSLAISFEEVVGIGLRW